MQNFFYDTYNNLNDLRNSISSININNQGIQNIFTPKNNNETKRMVTPERKSKSFISYECSDGDVEI
jgi:hypothetical protein